jgi:hypothetical protein
MTPAETAEKIAGMLRGMGLEARVHDSKQADGAQWVVVGSGSMEEPVFEVTATESDRVLCLSLRLGRTKALRARTVWASEDESIAGRCKDIADRFREHVANREAQQKAWGVVDELKRLGMLCTARDGRVVITLDLSPEYAADVGPKIAAVMGERTKQ